jgi:hypothetical protein
MARSALPKSAAPVSASFDSADPDTAVAALQGNRAVTQYRDSARGERAVDNSGVVPVIVIPQDCDYRYAGDHCQYVGARFRMKRACSAV